MRYRWLRFTLVALVLLIALVAALVVVVSTPWFRRQVRDFAVRQAAASLNGTLEIGSITGSLLHDVTLHDVLLRQQGEPVIRIPAITAKFDAMSLVRGRYILDELIVDRPVMRVVQEPQGWNLASLLKPRPTSTGPAVVFHILALKVIDGQVRVEPMGRPATDLASVDVEGALTYDQSGLSLDIARSDLVDRTADLPVTALSGRAAFGDVGMRISNLIMVVPGLRLTGGGSIPKGGGGQEVDAQAEFKNFAPTRFNFYLPQAAPTGLLLSGQLTARGRLEGLAAHWILESNAGATDGELQLNAVATPIVGQGRVSVTKLDWYALTGRRDFDRPLTARATFDGLFLADEPARSKVSFTLSSGLVGVGGYRVTTIDGRGRLADGVLRATGRLSAYQANATFDAVVSHLDRPGMPAIRANGLLRHLNLQELPPATKAPMIVTDISGNYALEVTRSDWMAHLVAGDSTVSGAHVRQGAVLQAEAHQQSLSASVDGDVTEVSGALLRLPDTKPTSLNGTVHANVVIPDTSQPITPDRVVGSARIELSGSTVQGTAVERASANASLEHGLLDVRDLHIESPALLVNAVGTVAFEGAEASGSDLSYTIDASDLSTLASLGIESLRGAAHVEGRIEGPAGRLETTGEFATQRIGYGDIAEALVFNGTYTVKVPDLDVARIAAKVDGESTFVNIKGQEINRLVVTGDYEAQKLDLQARVEQRGRAIDVTGGMVLHPDHREVHVREFALSGVGEPWKLEGPEATVDYRDDRASVEHLVLTRGAERIEADGTVVFAGDAGGSNLDVKTTALQVGDVYALLSGTPKVTGTADATIHMTGTVESPEAQGTLTVTDGTVMDTAFAKVAGSVSLKNRRAALDARVEEAAGSALVVKGTVPIAKDAGNLDLTVKSSEVSLGLAQAFTTQIQKVVGTVGLDLAVTGPLDAPLVAGDIAIANGGFLVPVTGVTYQNLKADVGFDGRRANIRQLTITDDDGHELHATGGADVIAANGERQLDISVQTAAIHVLEGDIGDVEVSTDARVRGTLTAPDVSGRVVVNKGRIEIGELLRQLTPASSAPSEAETDPAVKEALAAPAAAGVPAVAPPPPPQERETPAPDTSVFSRATLHVDVVMPDNIVMRGRNIKTSAVGTGLGDMNLTVGGTIELRKNAGETPVIVGAVEVVRGFYEFQGRRFEVTRGSEVRFRGVQPVNPNLEITGEREVSGVIARVHVTGTASQPVLELTSQPPLDEADVLSLIVFNQPINELGEGEQVDLLSRAGDLAAGMLATPLADSLGRALDVDLFEIKPPSSGEAGEVSVGNQFNERLFVAFRQQFGASEGSQLSFEYRLTQALRLLTTVGQGGSRTGANRTETAGMDVVYLIRY